MNEERRERWRSKEGFLFLLLIFLKKFSFGGYFSGKGRIGGDWKVRAIRVHDVKFPKN